MLVNVLGSVVKNLPTTVVLNSSPSRRNPYILQLPVKTAELSVGKSRTATVEFNLTDIKVGLEDLSCVAPGREVCDGIRLIRDWIPELNGLVQNATG